MVCFIAPTVYAEGTDANTKPPTTQQQSTVFLNVHILKDGSVESTSIRESSGDEAIDAEAIKAVKTWKFTPVKDSNGEAIEVTTVVRITFKPKG